MNGQPVAASRRSYADPVASRPPLVAAGVQDLVTTDAAEYEELAVTLANDVDKLWQLRRKLEEGRDSCALFDTARWVRGFEKGLDKVWERHAEGLERDHVTVEEE